MEEVGGLEIGGHLLFSPLAGKKIRARFQARNGVVA